MLQQKRKSVMYYNSCPTRLPVQYQENSNMIYRCATQMYLAMVWNRVDIAEEKIFSNRELVWKEGELDMVMIKPS